MGVLRAWDVNFEGHTRRLGVQVGQNELSSFLHRRRQSQHLHLRICVGCGVCVCDVCGGWVNVSVRECVYVGKCLGGEWVYVGVCSLVNASMTVI